MSVIHCWNRCSDMFYNCIIFVILNKRKSPPRKIKTVIFYFIFYFFSGRTFRQGPHLYLSQPLVLLIEFKKIFFKRKRKNIKIKTETLESKFLVNLSSHSKQQQNYVTSKWSTPTHTPANRQCKKAKDNDNYWLIIMHTVDCSVY